MTALLRIRQGIRALFAFATSVDLDTATAILPPDLMAIFAQMPRVEQQHSLNVLRDVNAQATHTPPDLAIAALLHDIGKSRYPLAVWQKTLVVLVRAVAPSLADRLNDADPQHPLYRAFVVKAHHAEWGAQMLANTSASPTTIWLVRHHGDAPDQWRTHPDHALLIRLKTADDLN